MLELLRPGIHGAVSVPVAMLGGVPGLPPFMYDNDALTFVPYIDKRLAPGPFSHAPYPQGDWDGTGTPDVVSIPRGTQRANPFGTFYDTIDAAQGTILFWITPEWDGNDGLDHYHYSGGDLYIVKTSANNMQVQFRNGGSWFTTNVNVAAWTAGTTYLVASRWDGDNPIDGSNYACTSINNVHTFERTSAITTEAPNASAGFGVGGGVSSSDAIIEGFTIYRRVLYDGTYGTRPANGIDHLNWQDELAAIYAAGAGRDPVLVTGSDDVCTCIPTNSTAEALANGSTVDAWSWPWGDNLPSVPFMSDGGYASSGGSAIYAVEYSGTATYTDCGSDASLDDLPAGGHFTIGAWVRLDSSITAVIAAKTSSYNDNGFILRGGASNALFTVRLGTTDMQCQVALSQDAKWHYVAAYYNDTTKVGRISVDGVWGDSHTGVGAYATDAAGDLIFGRRSIFAGWYWDGGIGWIEFSDNDRHGGAAGTDFVVPRVPYDDGNTVESWHASDGSGATLSATVAGANDGTITSGSWSSPWTQDGSPVIPSCLEFYTENDGIDFGSGANIDNLFAADCTIEFCARIPVGNASSTTLFSKANPGRTAGWSFYLIGTSVRFKADFANTDIALSSGNGFTDDRWHHYVIDWDQGTLTARFLVDGIEIGTSTAVGAYTGDAADDLIVNGLSLLGSLDLSFAIGPIRLSDNRRYTTNNFVPPDMFNWPANDANAQLITTMRDGAGTTVTDYSGNGYNGTVTFGATTRWWNTPDMESVEPGARMYGWGYFVGSDSVDDGIVMTLPVTAGNDYVQLPRISQGPSGRGQCELEVWDLTGAAQVVSFLGPKMTGVDAGAGNAALLTDANGRWLADFYIGWSLYNTTDGSSTTVTDNTETTMTGTLSGGTDDDWDIGDTYLLRPPRGSYDLFPWAESFCWEVPAGCTSLELRIRERQGEGSLRVQQLQVLPNLVDNGDHEQLTGGNPDLIVNWNVGTLDPGDTQASSGGGAIIHSGSEALQWNATASGEYTASPNITHTVGQFYASGFWSHVVGGGGSEMRWYPQTAASGLFQYTTADRVLDGTTLAQWEQRAAVWRALTATWRWYLFASAGTDTKYTDDTWLVELDTVTLTVIPASFANAQETLPSGKVGTRVGGRTQASQPIPVGYLTAYAGILMWDWTQRHDDGEVSSFGNVPYIWRAWGDANNYIYSYWFGANNIRIRFRAAGGAVQTATWATGGAFFVPGVTHKGMVLYGGTFMTMFVDGTPRATITAPTGFTVIPATMYWGQNFGFTAHLDAVFSNP